MTIHARFRMLLDDLNTTQGKFAVMVGINQEAVSRIVSEKSAPAYSTLERVAHAFPTLSCRWLLTGEGERWPEGLPSGMRTARAMGEPMYVKEPQLRYGAPGLEEKVSLLERLVAQQDETIRLLKSVLPVQGSAPAPEP